MQNRPHHTVQSSLVFFQLVFHLIVFQILVLDSTFAAYYEQLRK